MKHLAVAVALTVAPISGAQAQTGGPQSDWPPEVTRVSLTGLVLDAKLTRDQAVTRWGDTSFRSWDWRVYPLDTGGELHLLFNPDAPHRLVRAIVYRPDGSSETLFHHNPRAAGRRIEQLDPCFAMAGTAYRIWGAPDYSIGSGMVVSYYEMANGEMVSIPPWRQMRGVEIAEVSGGKRRPLGRNDCKLPDLHWRISFELNLPPPSPVPPS